MNTYRRLIRAEKRFAELLAQGVERSEAWARACAESKQKTARNA